MTKYNTVNLVQDAILNYQSYFSVVMPEESINLVYDPEITDYNNYVIVGPSSASHSNEEVYYGNKSLKMINFIADDTIEHTLKIPLQNETFYTFSVSVKGNGKFALFVLNDDDEVINGITTIETYNFWHRHSHTFYCVKAGELSTDPPYNNCKLIIKAIEDSAQIFFSGFQLEPKQYPTTFISGNMKGLQLIGDNSYQWVGQPNNSMSIRLGNTNTGGRVISFNEMGFDITTIEGLLLPEFEHNTQELLDNFSILYYGSKVKNREFTLGGYITGKSLYSYLNRLNILANAFNPSTNRNQQPIKLLLQLYDGDMPISEIKEILCLYNGGISEFNSTNGMAASIDFTMFTPFLYNQKWESKQLDLNFINSGKPVIRDQNGEWAVYSQDDIDSLCIGNDNLIWAGLSQTVSNGAILRRLEGNTWTTIANVQTTGSIHVIYRSRDNKYLYLGGQFGGIHHPTNPLKNAEVLPASTYDMNICRYDFESDTFEYIGKTSSAGIVYTIEELLTGELVIGGRFSAVIDASNVTTNTNNIAVYNPNTNEWSAWCQNGTGIYGIGGALDNVYSIKNDIYRNRLWVGGSFTGSFDSGGILLENIVSFSDYNYPEATADYRTEGVNDSVKSIVIDSKGTLYIGGYFTAGEDYYVFGPNTFTTEDFNNKMFSPTVARLYEKTEGFWRWENIGATFRTNYSTNTSNRWGRVDALTIDSKDQLWVGGLFDWVGDYANPAYDIDAHEALKLENQNANAIIVYSNGQWITNPGIMFNFDSIGGFSVPNRVMDILVGKLGTKYNTFTGSGTSLINTDYIDIITLNNQYDTAFTYSIPNNIVLNNSAIACKPVIEINGPGDLISIENATTGQIIYFNKTLVQYEKLIIDLSGLLPVIWSSVYGYNNQNIIRNASVLKNFTLHGGRNTLFARFNPYTANDETSVYIKWQNRYLSFDIMLTIE